MTITYNGTILHDQQLNTIIQECERHNIDARFAIVQAYFETRWGTIGAGKTNNNWAGITWVKNYKGNPDAEKSKGGNRPADEGGNYVLYPTADDGIKDWIYLLRPGNLYNVAGARTISDYVKGLFKNGGNAKADYAGSGYDHYLRNMTEIYNGMKDLLEKLGGIDMAVTAAEVIKHAKTYLGVNELSSRFKVLIDKYNTQSRLPRGTKMSIYWEWCAAFVSVIAMELGITDLIGTEISVGFFRDNHFVPKGIWIGKTQTPQQGDIITWDWDGNGWPDHIGFVDYVKGGRVYTVEGNANEAVRPLNYALNDSRIYGYARPKYASGASTVKPNKTNAEIAKEVLNGVWGNGDNRRTRLESAGYKYDAIQAEVNKLMESVPETPAPAKKSIEEIAREVISGKWCSGDKRTRELTKAGYDHHAVQTKVNELLQPDLTAVAREVIAGKYGNGQLRIEKLKAKGFDSQAVQARVNELL